MERLKNIELEVAAENLKKEKYFRVMLVSLLAVIVLFSGFILNRFFITRRQKKIIEEQKQVVEMKNREMTDSINYAKRLQEAILPQLNEIRQTLHLDILYLPKDIIGGDFYFFKQHNGFLFLAVCDCTGHGIPGAIMSVVCHQALDKSIREFNLTDPGMILDKTKEIVIENLNADKENIKDGMDCSLLVIEEASRRMLWAGANNGLWLFGPNEIKELKADKQPVGVYENPVNFVTKEVRAEKGAVLYLFTDGYADQFGGPNAKKYKTKALKEFLMTIGSLPPSKQVQLLSSDFHNWKGKLDQVDDVTIAVLKV